MTDFDPFDSVPADEAEEAAEESVFDAPPADAPAPKKVAKKVVKSPSVGDGEGKIVNTFKEGSGFDASWVVVHSNTVAEANETIMDPEFKKLLDNSRKVASYFRGGSAAAPAKPASGGNNGRPAGASQAPDWMPPPPGDGWVYKSGLKKDGSGVWHAWAPPRGVEGGFKFHNPPK